MRASSLPAARRLVLLGVVTLAGMASPARAAETIRSVQASAGDMFRLAEQLVRAGKSSDAEALLSLLARDPDADVRSEARFRHAKILQAKGMTVRAAVLLREVLDEKPAAAPVRLELAAVLAGMGDADGAWRQLRAAQAAGLPPAVALLVDRFSQALRASRPSGISLEIAFAPDSNVNRATRSDTLGTVFGDFSIDEDGKAKSGTGLAMRSQAYRRFALGDDLKLLVRASGSADLYKASRFNDVALDVAAGPEFELGRSRINLELGATQRWFGQKPFVRSARVGAVVVRPLGVRTQMRVKGSAALVDNRLNDLQDGKSFWGEVSVERALSPTTGFAITASGSREAAKDPGYATRGWRLGLIGWRDLGRVTLTAGGEYGRLHADERLSLFPDKRRDRYSRLSVGATFRQLSIGGFAPVARFTRERNRSSIEFYDFRRRRTEIGIERAF